MGIFVCSQYWMHRPGQNASESSTQPRSHGKEADGDPLHLRKTALPEVRVELALRNALESETELAEAAFADERLLTLLGLRGPRPNLPQRTQEEQPRSEPMPRGRAGKRGPVRDEIGEAIIPDEKQVAGWMR